jgi:hypothetical protein
MPASGDHYLRKGYGMAERKRHDSETMADEVSSAQAVARYLADMTGQLESMARASKLELLAYLLAMARSEAEILAIEARPDPAPTV